MVWAAIALSIGLLIGSFVGFFVGVDAGASLLAEEWLERHPDEADLRLGGTK